MSPARRIVVAAFCLCVSLVFLWVPWTSEAGYSWLWSKPKPRSIQDDIVAEARQRWDAEYRANDMATVGEKWLRAVQQASPEEKERVKQEARRALEMAKLKRAEFNLSQRQSMSDEEVLNWLDQRDNFQSTFPEKANLADPGRNKIIAEWKLVVLPAKEWNERIRYASVDYRRIAMELAALTGLFALGLVLTPRRTKS
jgi:hypothetical protein